jgi:hypothetical protein
MEVFEIDTRVNIKAGSDLIQGFINQVCIDRHGVTYEVVYWHNSARQTIWLAQEEFEVVDHANHKRRIGLVGV